MYSNPCTPLAYRRQFHREPTRIPQPSPKLLRRSLSLRLRTPTDNIGDGNGGGGFGNFGRHIGGGGGDDDNNDVFYIDKNGGGSSYFNGGCFNTSYVGVSDKCADYYNTPKTDNSQKSRPLATSTPLAPLEFNGSGSRYSSSNKNVTNKIIVKELKNSKSYQFATNNMTTTTTTHSTAKKQDKNEDDNNGAAAELLHLDKNISPTTATAVSVAGGGLKKSICTTTTGDGGGGGGGDSGAGCESAALCLNISNNSPKCSQKIGQRHNNCRNFTNVSAKNSPISPINGYLDDCGGDDDDLDSLYSFTSVASGRSTMSGCGLGGGSGINCDHPHVARNGTTFSGRRMKYVVHCSSYAGQTGEEYLTPTQRAQKHIRRLKELLAQARLDLEQKDSEILRLTKEVVELRLFKASLNSPEERSNSSDAVTVRENNDMKTSQDVSPIADITDHSVLKSNSIISNSSRHDICSHLNPLLEKMCNSEMQSSFSDSGHFEDLTTASINSKDSYVQTCDKACGNELYDQQRQDLIKMYEEKITELIKCHDAQTQELKVTSSDRIEGLLQKLADCNTRYADLVPDYEQAKDKIRELEKQLEDLQYKLQEQEDKQNKMYLHMYQQGQEAERITHADQVLQFTKQQPNRVSVPELMQQLQVTQDELENIKDTNYVQESGSSTQILLSAKEAISLWLLGARKTMYRRLIDAQQTKNKVDPEITLQFLKSAVYYFLTDKENTQGHLNAIESILGFSDSERYNIDKARATK